MADSKEMSDVSQQPPSPSNGDPTDTDVLLPKDRLRRFFLAAPILSLLVGGALVVVEVTIIVVMLVAPGVVGVADEDALTEAQRGVLGGVTILILIEAIAFGVIDIGTNRQRAKLIKMQRNKLIKQLNNLRKRDEDDTDSDKSLFSLQQVGELLQEQVLSLDGVRQRFKLTSPTSAIKETTEELKMLNEELNSHTLRYMASLFFDLAASFWKWALTLLVISNNWLSVGVAIAGGVVYPLVVFWQKAIDPTP